GGMTLTSEGEALWRYCQAARDLEGETLAAIQGTAKQSHTRITITGPSSIMHARILPQCLPLIHRYSNLLLQFDIHDAEDRQQALQAGRADLAILSAGTIKKEVKHKLLAPEDYVLVAPQKWQKRKLEDI